MTSVTVDINDFSSTQFDPKCWINSVLKPSSSTTNISTSEVDDARAKDTTILVTKLQMVSESTSRQFDTLSTSVIKSMPRIMYDLKVISENAASTHQGVEAVKKNLGLIEGDTEQALNKLRRPHVAKTRMEECKALLEEKANELEEHRKAEEALDELMRKNQQEEAEKQEEEEKKRLAVAAAAKAAEEEKEEEERRVKRELEKLAAAEESKKLVVSPAVVEEVKNPEESPIYDEGLEYGHVQLPPLRSTPMPPRRIQTPTLNTIPAQQEDNSYLQQIQDSMTPQVSNVFKRIGVPVSNKLSDLKMGNYANYPLTFIAG